MRKLKAFSRAFYEKWHTSVDDSDVHHFAVVSICSTNDNHPTGDDRFNVLKLKFDDIDESQRTYNLVGGEKCTLLNISDEQAEKLVRFIHENRYIYYFVAHCDMGVCRSGAIVQYIQDIYKPYTSYEQFKRDNSNILPNSYTIHTLKKTYQRIYGKERNNN